MDEASSVKRETPRRRGRDIIERGLAAGASALDEREAKAFLARYDIPTPLGTAVWTAEEAARAFRALGRPAVLKALGPDIQHKSDRGLVAVDVRDEATVRSAFHRLIDLSAGRAQGVLVEEMVPHERELLVGMRRDEQFGPVVAFGLGGIFTEALHDVAFALAPLDDQDAAELIAGLGAQPLLGALRGLPRVDRKELTRIIRAVAQMAEGHPEIAEIDVNPLLVAGTSLVAADALVVLSAGGAGEGAPGVPRGAAEGARGGDAYARDTRGSGARAERPPRRLDAVFSPRAVAVIGASQDTAKWGGSLLQNLIDGGFEGAIYPVTPRGGTVFGLPAVTSVDELPAGVVDLAVVALGAGQATAVVEACGRRGIPAVMVIAAGYGEAGQDGLALEQGLVQAATAANITLIGPNCMGVLANSSRLNAVGFIALRPEPGPVSVVSQSGNIGTQLLMAAERRGAGIEKYLSTGNQAITDIGDALAYLADDEHTRVVMIYVEGLADGRRFYEVACRTAPKKPVVVMHGGMTAYGRRAASSHTGAMAGSAEVFKAAARQAGLILAADPDESLDIAACLAYLPLPRGRRVAVVTLGGGWGVLTADALAAAGLDLAELPTDVLAVIDGLLPPYWSHGNPIDLVASVRDGVPERIIELVAGCDAVDAVMALALVGSPATGRAGRAAPLGAGELNDEELALLEHIGAVMDASGKPIISVPLVPVTRSVFAAASPGSSASTGSGGSPAPTGSGPPSTCTAGNESASRPASAFGEQPASPAPAVGDRPANRPPAAATCRPVLLPTPTAGVRALAAMASYARYRERH